MARIDAVVGRGERPLLPSQPPHAQPRGARAAAGAGAARPALPVQQPYQLWQQVRALPIAQSAMLGTMESMSIQFSKNRSPRIAAHVGLALGRGSPLLALHEDHLPLQRGQRGAPTIRSHPRCQAAAASKRTRTPPTDTGSLTPVALPHQRFERLGPWRTRGGTGHRMSMRPCGQQCRRRAKGPRHDGVERLFKPNTIEALVAVAGCRTPGSTHVAVALPVSDQAVGAALISAVVRNRSGPGWHGHVAQHDGA